MESAERSANPVKSMPKLPDAVKLDEVGTSAADETVGGALTASDMTFDKPRRQVEVEPWWRGITRFAVSELRWGDARPSEPSGSVPRYLFGVVLVPFALERFVCFSALACADVFLQACALLPLRAALGIVRMLLTVILRSIAVVVGAVLGPEASSVVLGLAYSMDVLSVRRSQLLDVVRGAVLLLAVWAMGFARVSTVYHHIRNGSALHMYAWYNISEILDRLLSAMG